jgi:2-C-methyl-D-erythritol 2,4-cyclodiphosphate synthase
MIRVGIGYDTHRLIEGRRLILGGILISHDKGLYAFSDGDVLCHAVTDALFGAAGLPNIGVHFPDTDERYRGADSLALLAEACKRVADAGYAPMQLDANIIAQRPKLQPYVAAMSRNIADCLGLPLDCVSIKPRTNEGVGPEGREEAITAQAVVMIQSLSPTA